MSHFKYIIVGGGIAGVTAAETLSDLEPDDKVLLLTAGPLIKAVTNFRKVTKTLAEFDVEERPMFELETQCRNVSVVQKSVSALDAANKEIITSDGTKYIYDKLCICTGASPKIITEEHPLVLGIRDTETAKVFQQKLKNARRTVIVGNGGIATELAYEIEGCDVLWAVKDESITSTFIDAGASQFLLPRLSDDKQQRRPIKRTKYKVGASSVAATSGGALGPDWHEGLDLHGVSDVSHRIHVEYKVEVRRLIAPEEIKTSHLTTENFPLRSETSEVTQDDWPVYVELTNSKIYGCDFVVSATGVIPNTAPFLHDNKFDVAEDGGFKVNDKMQTSVPDVYAAGDVCTASWTLAPLWMQMRLWCQARQMGAYSAQCMVANTKGEDIELDFCFELFAHVTKFFNYKVVLLGKFNAQGLGTDHELLVRVTKGQEYVKVVLHNGRMHGAILIGETDLEETFENLILNQLDLTCYGEALLDPNIDIEDYFD